MYHLYGVYICTNRALGHIYGVYMYYIYDVYGEGEGEGEGEGLETSGLCSWLGSGLPARALSRPQPSTPNPEPAKAENRGVVVIETGSYLKLIDSRVIQLKAQGPSRTCNESQEEEERLHTSGSSSWLGYALPARALLRHIYGIYMYHIYGVYMYHIYGVHMYHIYGVYMYHVYGVYGVHMYHIYGVYICIYRAVGHIYGVYGQG